MKYVIRGFTLIELMIGMTIGLMVLAAITSVYLSARQTARINETMSRMQESGRFAMDMLADHIAHAGYYGTTIFPNTITGRADSTSPITYTVTGTDCGTNWVIDLTSTFSISNDTNPYASTCIDDVTSGTTRWRWIAGTDIIEIRNANPVQPTTINTGSIYTKGDLNSGALFVGGGTEPADADFSANSLETHEISAYAYYVAEYSFDSGNSYQPALMRVAPQEVSGNIQLQNQYLLPNIENMQVEVGIDSDNNKDSDTWSAADASTDFSRVSAIRIWMLLRADDADRTFNPDNSTITYSLGGNSVSRSDHFRRSVFVKTIRLRNINQMRGV